jgi:hypothetical protein
MISARLYETLEPDERKYWHSHVFEVKSGMLLMPRPTGVPEAVWEVAENKEMEEVVTLYGKIFHLWQTDKGHKLPLGEPQLMTSYTDYNQFDFDQKVGDRDRRFGEDHRHKREVREYIKEPTIHQGSSTRPTTTRTQLTQHRRGCRLEGWKQRAAQEEWYLDSPLCHAGQPQCCLERSLCFLFRLTNVTNHFWQIS